MFKKYSVCEKTMTAYEYCQKLKNIEYQLNKADQADRKAKYNIICQLKKITKW